MPYCKQRHKYNAGCRRLARSYSVVCSAPALATKGGTPPQVVQHWRLPAGLGRMARKKDPSAYERMLGSLKGEAFEDEVCARYSALIADFQRIPAKPSGDGGLDGLSHGQTRGYCCYGPEQDPVKLNTKGLKDDTVAKFNKDLRKLLEVSFSGRQRLVHAPTNELTTVMGAGNRIKNIYLVVSWFESHRVIGPINTAFNKYKKASKLRYVDPEAHVTVLGPKDLAAGGEIDEHTLFRIENRSLFERTQEATAAAIPAKGDFDSKFDALKQRRPDRAAVIDVLAQDFQQAWASAIALDDELASTSVVLHEALEDARAGAATSARLRSLASDTPYELIAAIREDVVNRLGESFGQRLGALTTKVADGVVAGLIGECPLEWRDDSD